MRPSTHGIAHVFERNSVAPQHKILEAALVKGCGQLDLAQLKDELADDDQSGARRFGVFRRGTFWPRSFP